MFINCQHCNALVATDPATDAPPERCPRCSGQLRDAGEPARDVSLASPLATPPSVDATTTPPSENTTDDAWQRAAGLVAALAKQPASEAVRTDTPAPARSISVAPLLHAQTRQVEDTHAPPSMAAAVMDGPPSPTANDVTAEDTPVDVAPLAASTAPTSAIADNAPPARVGPSFVTPRRSTPRQASPSHRWRMPVALSALTLLLILQVLLADRERLAQDAQWRPLVSTLCTVTGCTLPPWREASAFSLLARDVRPAADRSGVLRASATFRNDARWAQAWPALVLTLSDVNGRTVGARTFSAAEYLGGSPTEITLASGQSAMIRLDVVEPSASVVAFSFEFH